MATSKRKAKQSVGKNTEEGDSTAVAGNLGEERKGIFAAEAILAICRKVGLTEKELREISVRAVRHNQKLAKNFDAQIAQRSYTPQQVIDKVGVPVGAGDQQFLDWGPSAGCMRLENTDPYRNLKVEAVGLGDGLLTTTVKKQRSAAFLWSFTPLTSALYYWRLPYIVAGPYYVIADDGPCEDKYASLAVNATIFLGVNGISAGKVNAGQVLLKRVTNASIFDNLAYASGFPVGPQTLQANQKVTVVISLTIAVEACGGGSFAVLNMDQGKGVFWAPYLDVCWIDI